MTRDNIQELLNLLEFEHEGNLYSKRYDSANEPLKVDISGDGHIYYRECGITIGRETTCNLLEPENLVVLDCVDRLLTKGYSPFHIELEPAWKLGHSSKGGYADVWVRTFKNGGFDGSNENKESLLIIECKTWGREFDGAWIDTKDDGAQLFSYFQQEPATKFLCLYTSDIVDGKVVSNYHLINVQDNEDLLANDENAQSYQNKNNKERYRVWRDTYKLDYATHGLFEKDIEPYRIGKNKFTVDDLNPVDNDTIQKKYNEFALILRQHNVGGHENAFDKLVNLFLAKVVDETNNPDDLNFYWKGSSYDDDYRLQDRLQRLYRDGMKRFLNEDVTYIENSQIEKAFRRFKNDPDATKKTIMEYFRALKFFSDNDFSFISVHNKRLFEQNAAILLKVVKMLQDIRLKDSDQNQLLGDLFEGFLNKGVKQSEGQYFTPMPIVRFLVSSLPLEQIIKDSDKTPNVIDYACGAGHFLTEYALQIEEYVKQYRPAIPLKEYYAHIIGIEKEYRLSKVSKVSAFMYGHDETNIIYADALVPQSNVKEDSFDILIANPPYSVKGFLETLTESQRKHYSLFNDNINIGKNNAIETFFIERAAQLLKAGGVAGIILPVSVLNKVGIYAQAREIILQKFDLVALVEFDSGTFGKTSTNTVTMFLRRKETNTPDAEHYRNRVESWFQQHHEGDEAYEDEDLLANYCEHCGYDFEDYVGFLSGDVSDSFMQNELIQTYSESFLGNQRNAMKGVCDKAKEIRTRFRNRQNTQAYRRLPDDEKKKQEQKAFMQFVTEIEKEKVYYFILAKKVPNPVVIVKSPSGTTNMKHFLGYEWSDTKGNEGIKYLNVATQNTGDDEGNSEDDDTLEQIKGIKGIQTPLFNPQCLDDSLKINTIIRQNFSGVDIVIPDELSEHVEAFRLVDLIDFKRTDFTKAIKTTPILSYPQIESKYSSEKLGVVAPYVSSKIAYSSIVPYSYVTTANMLQNRGGVVPYDDVPEVGNVTEYKKGDILVSNIRPYLKKIWFADHDGGCSNDVLVFRNAKPVEYLSEYLYAIMSSDIFFEYMMVGKIGLKMPRGDKKIVPKFLIPSAPKDIQKIIIEEWLAVDGEWKQNEQIYNKEQERIKSIFDEIRNNSHFGYISVPLEELLLDVQGSAKKIQKREILKTGNTPVITQEMGTLISGYTDNPTPITDIPLIVFGDHSCSVKYIDFPFVRGADGTQLLKVDKNVLLPKYLYGYLLTLDIHNAGKYERHFKYLKEAIIKFPQDVSEQQKIVEKIEFIESKMENAFKIMKNCILRKQEILDKYLK